MARRSSAATKRATAADNLTEDQFLDFLDDVANAKQAIDDANMSNANAWKKADKLGIHSQAAKLVQRLRKMEPLKRADFLRSFDKYRPWAGLDEQPDMLDRLVEQDNEPAAPVAAAPASEPEAEAEDDAAGDGTAAAPRGDGEKEDKPATDWGAGLADASDAELEDAGHIFNSGLEAGRGEHGPEKNPHADGSTKALMWERGRAKGAAEAAAGGATVVPLDQAGKRGRRANGKGKADSLPPAATTGGESRPVLN
jgi:hypothetical protein